MKFQDINLLHTLIDERFLYSQGFSVSLSRVFNLTDFYFLVSEVALKGISPHPLFDLALMRRSLGVNWLENYIDQPENAHIFPNALVNMSYFSSQIYTSGSPHLSIFSENEISLNPDFDPKAYILASNKRQLYQHLFADFSFRSGFKIISPDSYKKLFL